jgi:Arc/MetJ-type ribon-helix-helix transcriptional regulator
MSSVTVELPDALADELNAAVRAGWFATQAEAERAAVEEYFREEKLARLEQQQLSDIAWAVKVAKDRE